MKAWTFITLASCLLALFVISCKKSTSSSKSNTTYVTQTSWKIQSVGVDLDKNGTVDADATSSLQGCQLDNIYTFKSD